MGEFTMPSLGADMTEGTLTEWLVQPGDRVRKGDIVAVVDTAKADIEVECFEAGVVERLLVEPGTLVPVGTALAVITAEAGAEPAAGAPGAGAPAAPSTAAAPRTRGASTSTFPREPGTPGAGVPAGGAPAPSKAAAPEAPVPAAPTPAREPGRPAGPTGPAGPLAHPAAPAVPASSSPLIRHLALERGVNLAAVHGTGRGGRITRADILAAQLAAPPPLPPGAAAEVPGRAGAGGPGVGPGPAREAPHRAVRRGRAQPPTALAPDQGSGAEPVVPPVAGPARGAPAQPVSAPAPDQGSGAARGEHGAPARLRPEAAAAGRAHGRVRATPLARRLAAEAGLDLAGVHGTGAQGAVRAEDVRGEVRRAAQAGPPAGAAAGPASDLTGPHAPAVPVAPPATARPPAGPAPAASAPAAAASRAAAMRRAIGDLMARSKREIPHYYLATTVDLAAATDWLRERNLKVPVTERLVPAALLLKAAACAAREVPALNGFWIDGGFVPAPAVHLGVAVSLRGGGLVAPAIHDAADLPLPEIMARLRDLVARARAGRLRGSETADPTITVTSLGDQGVEAVFGVIYPPQVALVGLGKVVERPCAVGGLLGVRPVVTATLSADHRASDGATGARYLTAFDRMLQRPEEL